MQPYRQYGLYSIVLNALLKGDKEMTYSKIYGALFVPIVLLLLLGFSRQSQAQVNPFICGIVYYGHDRCSDECLAPWYTCLDTHCDSLWPLGDHDWEAYSSCRENCSARYISSGYKCVHDECDCKYFSEACPDLRTFALEDFPTDCPGMVTIDAGTLGIDVLLQKEADIIKRSLKMESLKKK